MTMQLIQILIGLTLIDAVFGAKRKRPESAEESERYRYGGVQTVPDWYKREQKRQKLNHHHGSDREEPPKRAIIPVKLENLPLMIKVKHQYDKEVRRPILENFLSRHKDERQIAGIITDFVGNGKECPEDPLKWNLSKEEERVYRKGFEMEEILCRGVFKRWGNANVYEEIQTMEFMPLYKWCAFNQHDNDCTDFYLGVYVRPAKNPNAPGPEVGWRIQDVPIGCWGWYAHTTPSEHLSMYKAEFNIKSPCDKDFKWLRCAPNDSIRHAGDIEVSPLLLEEVSATADDVEMAVVSPDNSQEWRDHLESQD